MKKWLTALLLVALTVLHIGSGFAACEHDPKMSVDWPSSVDASAQSIEVTFSVKCKNCDLDLTSFYEKNKVKYYALRGTITTATCTEDGISEYTFTLTSINGDLPTLTASTRYVTSPRKGHDLVQHEAKEPTCTEAGYKAYEECSRWSCNYTTYEEIGALGHDLVQREAKEPTCTEAGYKAYEECKRANCGYTTYEEIPASGHHYTVAVTEPTCTEAGKTIYTCTACGDAYVDQKTAARGHWYGEWRPEGDNAHRAECRRDGCGYEKTVSCVDYACQLSANHQTMEAFDLCPVCGQGSNGMQLMLVDRASATADRLPRGEVLVRTGETPSGERVMTVGFEFDGQMTLAQGPVKISLPAELLDGCCLCLVAADGSETELPFSVKDGFASFSLDFTDAQSPMQLIHMLAAL